jgi:hypothetical protein
MSGNDRWMAFGRVVTVALAACAWSTRAGAGSGDLSCWDTPVNVQELNTSSNDMYAVLTRDGLEVYFTSNRPGGLGGDDLWMATRASVDYPWGPPVNLTALNSPSADSLPMLSHSGNVMWFTSDRPGPGSCGGTDLWQARRDPRTRAWGDPVALPCTLSPPYGVNTPFDDQAPAFYANDDLGLATLYLGSTRTDPDALGSFDVYETSTADEDLYNAAWTPAVHVPIISSSARDTRTWIGRNGLELFITSNRVDGSLGGFDIWYSTREANTDDWSPPGNLGPPINTASDEGSPSLTWDGNTLYFFSTRPGGLGGRDIWMSRRIPCP